MELLARRDVKRLMPLCGARDAAVREAIALIARLEPKPGRRFVNVERNIVVPDVLVIKSASGASQISGAAQHRRDAAPARARHLRQCPQTAQGRRQ